MLTTPKATLGISAFLGSAQHDHDQLNVTYYSNYATCFSNNQSGRLIVRTFIYAAHHSHDIGRLMVSMLGLGACFAPSLLCGFAALATSGDLRSWRSMWGLTPL